MAAPSKPIAVIRTGTANVASVVAGLRRAGAEAHVTDDPGVVRGADRVVLPGVGAFGAAADALRQRGLDDAFREHAATGRPFLAVCLGLQLLCASSDESAGASGLGILGGHVTRFGGGVKVPQLGWNQVVVGDGCALLEAGYAYFANSYRLEAAPAGWSAATAEYGGPFVAAVERGPQLACQFHPELSGGWGRALLARWVERAR